MNLQPITNPKGNPFLYRCLGCNFDYTTDREPGFADLDGEAFRAYYCVACGNSVRLRGEDSTDSAGRKVSYGR